MAATMRQLCWTLFMLGEMIACVGVMLVASGCVSTTAVPSGQQGQVAPDFSISALDGRRVSLSDYSGKVVILDFWASWCPPCQESLPHIASLATNAELARRGLVVLAVNEQEAAETIRAFVEQQHLALTVLRDADGTVARSYAVSSMPTTVIIGRDRVVQTVLTGLSPDSAKVLEQALTRALDEPPR
ncbi:MAG: TlpA disulfide reductase family protein [Phycisphaerae bacterium]